MKKTREKRIRTLELTLRSRARPSMVFRYGSIRYLPPDTGERHIAIVKSEPTALANVVRCAFEERLGPAPEAHHELTLAVYLSAEDQNGNSS